ncbi:MAG: hypothetical protein IJA94_02605 [Bacilli bacterium]|nr:hypothetical protein [Bacilli bacterium]
MNKQVKLILLSYIFFSLSCGIFYNFQELWMASNGLSLKTIGIVYSLCALLSVSIIFLFSNLIGQEKLKDFTCLLLVLKFCTLFLLFILNNSNNLFLIKFIVMIDYVLKVVVSACIYPLLSIFDKSDKLFAAKTLIYSWLYYLGIFFTSFLLGKTLGNVKIEYNSFCLIGAILITISFLILRNVKIDKKTRNKIDNNVMFKITNKIKNDKITLNYLGYLFTNEIAYSCVTRLIITIFVTTMGFSDIQASNLNLALCVLSAFLGTIILAKFTMKNNYINFAIKYFGRCLFYFLAFLFGTKLFMLIATIYTMILSDSYVNVTDAPYVNRFSKEEQLAFSNLKEMISYIAVAIGMLICSITLQFNFKYNFLVATIFIVIATLFGFNAIRLHNIEKENEK